MKRIAIVLVAVFGLCAAYVVAHWALIEIGREVIVLRTENPDGGWLETRLWIVDDGSVSWLAGFVSSAPTTSPRNQSASNASTPDDRGARHGSKR